MMKYLLMVFFFLPVVSFGKESNTEELKNKYLIQLRISEQETKFIKVLHKTNPEIKEKIHKYLEAQHLKHPKNSKKAASMTKILIDSVFEDKGGDKKTPTFKEKYTPDVKQIDQVLKDNKSEIEFLKRIQPVYKEVPQLFNNIKEHLETQNRLLEMLKTIHW